MGGKKLVERYGLDLSRPGVRTYQSLLFEVPMYSNEHGLLAGLGPERIEILHDAGLRKDEIHTFIKCLADKNLDISSLGDPTNFPWPKLRERLLKDRQLFSRWLTGLRFDREKDPRAATHPGSQDIHEVVSALQELAEAHYQDTFWRSEEDRNRGPPDLEEMARFVQARITKIAPQMVEAYTLAIKAIDALQKAGYGRGATR